MTARVVYFVISFRLSRLICTVYIVVVCEVQRSFQDGLFVLVADQGFLNEPSVVWETLNSVDGSSVFVDASFNESRPADAKETSE